VRELIESELLAMLAENREALLDRLSAKLIESAKGNSEMARQAADEGLDEVQRLLANHSEAL
ncbi:MAG: EF-1 guanine nucleotide exchange domain-containing protein, partial [Prochlorococcus sp.]